MGFNGLIEVGAAVGTTEMKSSGPVGKYIKVPSTLPGKPRVTVQARDAKGDVNGPCFCFDYEADQGRGVWVMFDPDIHKVPPVDEDCCDDGECDCEDDEVNAALSDPEPDGHTQGRSLDMSASSAVEYDQSADAPADDCDDKTCDDEDIDIENSSPRGW
jgi:hypothetical protein